MNLVLAQKMAQPVIPAEVIQKLNVFAAARAVASAARGARSGVRNFAGGARVGLRAGYRSARTRRVANITVHNNAAESGAAFGGRAGLAAGRATNRIIRARAAGSRIGAGLRAGYGYGRALGARRPLSEMTPAVRAAFERSYASGARASLGAGLIAGHRVRRVSNGAAAFRTWVNNARVAGGGFWRRNT